MSSNTSRLEAHAQCRLFQIASEGDFQSLCTVTLPLYGSELRNCLFSIDASGVSAAFTKNLEQSLMKVEVLRLCTVCTIIACKILDFIWRAS